MVPSRMSWWIPLSSDELGVVVGDFISGIVILGFCDGIVLGFFGSGHVVVIGVLWVVFSAIALIEVLLWGYRVSLIMSMVKYGAYKGSLGLSGWIGVWITLISQLLFLKSMGLLKDYCCCLWMIKLWDYITITIIDKPIIGILSVWGEWMNRTQCTSLWCVYGLCISGSVT